MELKPKIIIGLGNPDPEYANTYHNVGYLFVDYLNEKEKREHWIKKPFAIRSKSYMNNSGRFIVLELKKSGAKPEELLVIHDDSDIELGKYKLSFGRGAAGHHGVESVQQHLKTNEFWRLRIGIRPPQEANPPSLKLRRARAGEFVLKKITATDKKILERVFEDAAKKIFSRFRDDLK